MERMIGRMLAGLCLLWLSGSLWAADELPLFDFTKAGTEKEWRPSRDVEAMQASAEGLIIRIRGVDPYLNGPPRNYPPGRLLWVHVRINSEEGGSAQIFYYRDAATEANSVHFDVRAGGWRDIRVPLPALGPNYRIRIDPPGSGGKAILARLAFEERVMLAEPAWPVPQAPVIVAASPSIRSGDLQLTHGKELGGFDIRVAGKSMAAGFNRPLVGYLKDHEQRWLDLGAKASVKVSKNRESISVVASAKDPDGATWQMRQRFRPVVGQVPDLPRPRQVGDLPHSGGAIEVEAEVVVDQDRSAVFVPILLLLPGKGSFGASKTQALLAGLEYLDKDEPSSSEADIVGPGAKRQVPDSAKITFPLMTIAADGRYLGIIWDKADAISALFDSPDRIFKSGGHVMGLIFPGASPDIRTDGSVLPITGEKLAAGKPVRLRATIIGGLGASVIPAVQRYVELRGMPPIPKLDLQSYIALAAAGWLDSAIVEGHRYRHAFPGHFDAHPSSDAALMMDWLAAKAGDQQLARRLRDAASAAIGEVPPADYNYAAVAHVRYPVEALLYGHVAENAVRARRTGEQLLRQLEPDGSVRYRATKNIDYGKTHFAPDANGLTSKVVEGILEAAAVSGDRKLASDGLRALRSMDKFAATVPRGAQTWEVPLHTPDILASAQLVRAYTLGYELTGDSHFLEMARYWAWTGIPFVYLTNPTDQPISPYATIPVLGATHWVAPNWMGLPVQWCGLVYADALYRLAPYDPAGPWRKAADGITASGIQQTWPLGKDPKRQGLLPDSVSLRQQHRNDVAINPGTVQAPAIRFFGEAPAYDFRVSRKAGAYVHAPGEIRDWKDLPKGLSFGVHGAIKENYDVLVSNCGKPVRVKINGRAADQDKYDYDAGNRWLVIHLTGDATVELELE